MQRVESTWTKAKTKRQIKTHLDSCLWSLFEEIDKNRKRTGSRLNLKKLLRFNVWFSLSFKRRDGNNRENANLVTVSDNQLSSSLLVYTLCSFSVCIYFGWFNHTQKRPLGGAKQLSSSQSVRLQINGDWDDRIGYKGTPVGSEEPFWERKAACRTENENSKWTSYRSNNFLFVLVVKLICKL